MARDLLHDRHGALADERDGHRMGADAVVRDAAGGVESDAPECVKGVSMTVAEDLLRRHIETLVANNARWQTMLADDVVWELPFAPALGHPARVSGRTEVVQFAAWFVGAVENFRFFDVRVQAFADPEAAVAEVKGEGRIKATGRSYRQEYVVFLRAVEGKIAFLREYFDPTRAAKAMNTAILDRDS